MLVERDEVGKKEVVNYSYGKRDATARDLVANWRLWGKSAEAPKNRQSNKKS
jgi:hypothetical protein